MSTISINRGEQVAIPFTITDAANGLAGKRVTWSVSASTGGARVLRKVGGLPGSTAAITGVVGDGAGTAVALQALADAYELWKRLYLLGSI